MMGHWTVDIEFQGIDLRAMAIICGIPLVDLSIDYEPHLVRGTE